MKSEILANTIENLPICIGSGLVALDVVISNNSNNPTQFLAGGSCGNVLTILSFLGWQSYPVARLSNDNAAELLIEDLQKWNVSDNLITITEKGSTPIIIHRILKWDSQNIDLNLEIQKMVHIYLHINLVWRRQ